MKYERDVLMNIAVCDDDFLIHKELSELIKKYFYPSKEYEIDNYAQGISLIKSKKRYDIIFMDIELHKESGIDIAERIKMTYPLTVIIFISNYPKYVTQSYHVDAFQFLVKPIKAEIFNLEFERCLKYIEKCFEVMIRRVDDTDIFFKKSEIVYIESRKRVLYLYLHNNETFHYYGKLADEEKYLSDNGFVRCHKSFIINLAYVRMYDNKDIVTYIKKRGYNSKITSPKENYITVPIGAKYYNRFKETFIKYAAGI